MARMTWNAPERRFFETGLDRGVLYPKKVAPPGPLVASNLIPNPSFELDIQGWTNYNTGTVGTSQFTRTANPSTSNGQYNAVVTATGLNASTLDRCGIAGTTTIPVAANKKFLVGATFGGTLPVNRQFQLVVFFYNGTTLLTTSLSPGFATIGAKTLLTTAPATATGFRLGAFMTGTTGTSNNPVAINYWVDSFWASTDATGSYFDGSTTSTADYTYSWLGTPHLSTSYKRETTTLATPWDGLTSVEEAGGEAARAYYADGRPFLFMPIPKEFSATLNAYTYPDAFSEVMGLAEVTDGMYLDSQLGTAFDLSYRTKVGNATEGQDHGYKIHLVYNATVTPGNLTYETMGDSINPTTMSWEIQAVPVKVEGYRSTAHIVVDTRHMDPRKVASLEKLLYGSPDDVPAMPAPQLVFDILNYGDTIIVTDNGDGTFDVEGSYENVYLMENGEFRLNNIDGQNNGDGTFTISTTEG